MCNVIYVPSAFVSDGPEYRHYLPCLADASGNLTVMTTILQLRTRSCIKKYLYITKNPTHENGNQTICECEPLILVKIIQRPCQNFPLREVRTEKSQNKQVIPRSTARYRKTRQPACNQLAIQSSKQLIPFQYQAHQKTQCQSL